MKDVLILKKLFAKICLLVALFPSKVNSKNDNNNKIPETKKIHLRTLVLGSINTKKNKKKNLFEVFSKFKIIFSRIDMNSMEFYSAGML